MNPVIRRLIIASAVLCASAVLAEVETTWHRDADPSRFGTFDWVVPPEDREGATKGLGEQFDGMVREAVESQLQAMGYEKVSGETVPDFLIQYDAAATDAYVREIRPEVVPFIEEDWVFGQYETIRASFHRSTLILTVRDGATDEPVWCGWTTETLKYRKLERQTKKLVRRILSHYPPKGGAQEAEH